MRAIGMIGPPIGVLGLLLCGPIGAQVPSPERVFSLGPYVEFTGSDSALVHWQTGIASPSILEYGESQAAENRLEDPTPRRVHAVAIDGLKRDTEYVYRIRAEVEGAEVASDPHALETDFNFRLPDIPDRPSPYPF